MRVLNGALLSTRFKLSQCSKPLCPLKGGREAEDGVAEEGPGWIDSGHQSHVVGTAHVVGLTIAHPALRVIHEVG